MTSDQKTRLVIGILAAAVVILVIYAIAGGRKPAPAPTVQAPQTVSGEVSASSERIEGSPELRIETVSPVTVQSAGHEARVTSDAALSYKWAIFGGSFEGSDEGERVTWKAGNGGEVVLECRGTNAEGKANTATLRVPLRPPVEIVRFEAFPAVITEGQGAKLLWSVNHSAKLGLEPDGKDLSSSPESSLDVKPEKTITYALMAQGAAGSTVTKTAQIKVVPAPELLVLKAEPVSGSEKAILVTAEFKNGKAELKRGDQVIASSDASPLRHEVADMEPGTSLLLTVTNEAGSYVSNTLTIAARK